MHHTANAAPAGIAGRTAAGAWEGKVGSLVGRWHAHSRQRAACDAPGEQ